MIGIKLIDGLIAFSNIICLELCTSLPSIDECELDGTFELESAECGDTGEPFEFNGRTIACISNPVEVVAVTVVVCKLFCELWLSELLLLLLLLLFNRIPLFSLLSAIEISTCGVRKCIGGVALSVDRAESPLSLNAALLAAAANAGNKCAEFDCSNANNKDDGVPDPGLSKSIP